MQFQEFYTNATKYLPRIQLKNDSHATNVIILEASSYKETLSKHLPQHSQLIVQYLATISSFEGKSGNSAFVLVENTKYIVFLAKKGLAEKPILVQQEVGASLCNVLNAHKVACLNSPSAHLST